jgi:hypothetical protein
MNFIFVFIMAAQIAANANVIWRPHPGAQVMFHQSDADVVAYGGARGGGKSLCLLLEALRHIAHPDYKAIIFRRTYPQLSELIGRAYKYYRRLGMKWRGSDKIFEMPGGGIVKFAHCQHPKDVENYVGHEYQFLGIDQVEQFTEEMVQVLETCVRSAFAGLPCRIRYTSNPGSIGHLWFKSRFVDKCRPSSCGKPVYYKDFDITYQPVKPGKIFRDKDNRTTQYIPARVFDNPSLMQNDPNYVRRLQAMPEKLMQAHLFGDYDTFVGQFFDMWNHDLHVVRPFEIPPESVVNIFGGFDWGYAAPSCYGLAAVMPNWDVFMIREYYDSGKSVQYISEQIKRLDAGFKLRLRVADPSIWIPLPKSSDNKPFPTDDSIEMMFRKYGVSFNKANNNRINGWMAMREMMEYRNNGRKYPQLRFFENCTNCIRTIPAMVHDSSKPEDMDTMTEDHSSDMTRYTIMAIDRPSVPKPKEKTWHDFLKEDRQQTQKGILDFAA